MTRTTMAALRWAVVMVLMLPAWSPAIEVLDPDYEIEEYVTIEGASFGMTFDDAGNLYVLDGFAGRITKVTPEREVSVLVTIPPKPGGDVVSLIWTGGSAFGDFLYTFRRHPHSDLLRVDPDDGSWTAIASITHDCGVQLGLDRVGLYGGHLYTGTGCNDRIFRLTAGGSVSVFSAWPYGTNGGGPRGIDFDPSGRYDGYMYVASAYAPYSSHVSGIFRLDTAGNATRFGDAIVYAFRVLFAPAGPMFDQEMFVYGRVDYASFDSVWRVSPDGSAEELVRGIDSPHPNSEGSYAIAFGPDGALYVAQYFLDSDLTTIHRVFSPSSPVALAIARLKRAIDEKTVAIEAIDMALADEEAALEALESAELQCLLADRWIHLSIARQLESRRHLVSSRTLLERSVGLLENDCTGPGACTPPALCLPR